jgi:hypothetical protein
MLAQGGVERDRQRDEGPAVTGVTRIPSTVAVRPKTRTGPR